MTVPITSTHATLLARLKDDRDLAAWREFHDRYHELIRNFARRKGLQESDIDDVAQDVLMALSKAMPGFEYDPLRGKFRGYLKTVTLHAVFRITGQKRGEAGLEHIEEATRAACLDDHVEQLWEDEWRQYHMRQAMRSIAVEFGETDREAFQRYAVEGQDARVTADLLNISVDHVYQAKSRILRRLGDLIDAQVTEEG